MPVGAMIFLGIVLVVFSALDIIDYSGQLAHALKRVQRMGSAV